MKKRTVMAVALLLVLSLLLSACAAGVAQEDYDAALAQITDLEAEHDENHELLETLEATSLGAVLLATSKYHDVNVALADGYQATENCVQAPPGGMGLHYVNPSLAEAAPDPLKPAILLYLPTDAGIKLIGVEYSAAAMANTADGAALWLGADPPDSWATSAPSALGQTFNGPMAGHGPPGAEPWHYDLHVWLWEDNPSGLFADFNPNVHCPE